MSLWILLHLCCLPLRVTMEKTITVMTWPLAPAEHPWQHACIAWRERRFGGEGHQNVGGGWRPTFEDQRPAWNWEEGRGPVQKFLLRLPPLDEVTGSRVRKAVHTAQTHTCESALRCSEIFIMLPQPSYILWWKPLGGKKPGLVILWLVNPRWRSGKGRIRRRMEGAGRWEKKNLRWFCSFVKKGNQAAFMERKGFWSLCDLGLTSQLLINS